MLGIHINYSINYVFLLRKGVIKIRKPKKHIQLYNVQREAKTNKQWWTKHDIKN